MPDLKSAKISKRCLKSNITKFKEKVNSNIDQADVALLELFQTKILSLQNDLSAVFDTIFLYCDENETDEFITEKEDIQDNLDEINLSIKRKLLSLTESKNCNANDKTSVKDISLSEIKLPKITLPTFNGKIEEWIEFEDLFSASVHKNTSLTNAQKLQYLKSSCRLDALSIIQSIPISDANYEIAWNLLIERYSNKKELINAIIRKLLSLPQTYDSAPSILKFVDAINECVRSLEVLGQNVTNFSDTLLVYILVEKLDRNTRSWWERSLKKDQLGSVEQLTDFLKEHARTLQHSKPFNRDPKRSFNSKALTSLSEGPTNCLMCKGDHILLKCPQFLNLPAKKRFSFAKMKRLCYNCLSSVHSIINCKSLNTCRKCHKRHHTLIHLERGENNFEINNATSHQNRNNSTLNSNLSPSANIFSPLNYSDNQGSVTTLGENQQSSSSTHQSTNNTVINVSNSYNKQVLLSTAIIYVKNSKGEFIPLRALLDSGSQNNFITKECAELLKLKGKKINASVSGLNGSVMNIKETVITTISNVNKSFSHTLQFFIVPKITRITPAQYLNIMPLTQLQAFKLADPQFDKPGPIHVLLSNEVFFELLGRNKITVRNLIFQETVFGYIASGSMSMPQEGNFDNYCGLVESVDDLSNIMTKFWEIEGVHETQSKSQEEQYCEEHFLHTHFRREDGRYVVEMPIKTDGLKCLGESREIANKRLNHLVKRFAHNPTMKILYENFINEYSQLEHLEEVRSENNPELSYYLPHHGIYRPDKPTTKLRVVFDASAATTSGISLNDILLNGGIVQDELFDIICRFRTHKIAFTADIVKMYRQILIKEQQRDLLRIVWKCNEEDSAKVLRLKTVTYGTSNAPYLATRTLNQLAHDEMHNFPVAAPVLLKDFYVDDVLTGANTLAEAQELQSQLIELLARGGMLLHRWCANHPELLQLTQGHEEYSFNNCDIDKSIKTLGLLWNPKLDSFSFKSSVNEPTTCTKRSVLSDIARIYDPLGLLGPGLTKAKIFIQRLWLQKLGWDDPLPDRLKSDWQLFIDTMQSINKLNVNRYVLHDDCSEVELHGFSDASEHAYGAAIYLRCPTNSNSSTNLLCSKSRVAPLKPLTVPRLELCAAVLLSQLVSKVVTLLKLNINKVLLWCDSTIVLAWIQTSPHLLKTFVSNRVNKIQELTQSYKWHHVRSQDNPADLVSRGLNFDKLHNCDLWWHGPPFLSEGNITSNINMNIDFEQSNVFSSELKTKTDTLLCNLSNDFVDSILKITNNYAKLLRIISYIFRFVGNLKKPYEKRIGRMTTEEFNNAEQYLIREVQIGEFNAEYNALVAGKLIPNKSKLRPLNPFLDASKVLRVGGRLDKAEISFSQKHPIILPAKLCKLIASYYHQKYLHIGSQALLCFLRQKFWPLQGRNLVRKITHECVTCMKNKPITVQQIMGSLPTERVNSSAPFNHVGTDFCGPFFVRYKGQRKGTLNKVYLAIFICFITKAVHLELVSELTTDAFISTLKRFIARRGKCAVIFSDNAKNFVGAHAELQRFHNLLKHPKEGVANYLSEEGISWKFIPPRAPNFGGLWEAGIKSVKYHLRRTVGNARLTFEELLTVVTQIESILNSRPITPLSSDVNDLEALTPGHFLIGRPMTAIVEPDLINVNENRLSRWHRVTRWVQQIWNRWHREYLNTLQQRSKWQFEKNDVKIGTLVLIKEDDLPMNKYLLGRIRNVFPGTDGRVRVAEIRTAKGIVRRGISKIALLPQENSQT